MPEGLGNVVGVAAGNDYSLALRGDGRVVAWGNYWNGSSFEPVAVPEGLANVVAIAVGGGFNLALRRDGTVAAWGTYWNGEAEVPMTSPAGLSNVVAISAGVFHAMALVTEGPPLLNATLPQPEIAGNRVSIEVPTQSGRVYQLEYEHALGQPNWRALPFVPGNGGRQILTDPNTEAGARFYRVRQW